MDNELKPNKKKLSSIKIVKGIGILLTLTLVVLIANGVSKASFQDLSEPSDRMEFEHTTLNNQHSTFSEVYHCLEMIYEELPNNPIPFSEELQESDYERKRRHDEKREKHEGDPTMNSSNPNTTEKDNQPIPGHNDVELPHPGSPPRHNDDELSHPCLSTPGHIDVELEHPGSPNPGHIDVELEHPGNPIPGDIDVELEHSGIPNPGHIDVELEHPGSPNPGHIDVELEHPGSPNPGHIDVELEHPSSPNPGHIDVEQNLPGSPEDNR